MMVRTTVAMKKTYDYEIPTTGFMLDNTILGGLGYRGSTSTRSYFCSGINANIEQGNTMNKKSTPAKTGVLTKPLKPTRPPEPPGDLTNP